VRDFPDSRTEELGAYLLDELEIGDRLTLIPGLRYDRFRLAPQPDAIYAADNPATTPTALDDDALSAKLALAWQASEALDLYLQYAEGFRAPPFEDVNIGLDIALFGYRAIPNPDLQPEDSAGLELGARWVVPGTRASVAVFSTDYRDLIESKVNLGVDPLSGRTIFQSQNRARARIRGAEASIEHQRPASWGARWLLRAALSWAEGEDLTSGEPLNSVDPGELLAAAALEAGDGRWRVELVGTAVDGKDQVDDPASGRLFRTPGYGLLDLYLSRRIGRRLTLTLGVRNLTDRAYWRWAAVNGLLDNDPVVDLVAAPGRSATLALRAAL
jgi:hemoglobin/transferrin/lactoferrin receptor protein